MEKEKIPVRDRRRKNFYMVDNFVYDSSLSCEALAMYNYLCRHANNESQTAYFSGKKFKKIHKIGNAKVNQAREELIEKQLINFTGDRTRDGALYYEILDTTRLSDAAPGGVLTGEQGLSDAAPGGVLTGETIKTLNPNSKTKHLDAGASGKPPKLNTEEMDAELSKAILHIELKTGQQLRADKWLKIWFYNAVKEDGLNPLKKAIDNFCHNEMNIKIQRWDWISFFKIQAKRANFLPKKIVQISDHLPSQTSTMTPEEIAAHRSLLG